MLREFLKKFKPYFVGAISGLEIFILTMLYYFFWRIGYSHGLPGYPEYFGKGKYVLMIVYAIMLGFLLFSARGCRFGRIRILNLILRQWMIILIVNLITFLQLSLTAGHPVAKRPLFDATVVQGLFIVVIVIIADYTIKHYHVFGRMIAIGKGTKVGSSVDGYRVFKVHDVENTILDLVPITEMLSEYDSVLINKEDELTDYIIEHCFRNKIPVYEARRDPILYGINRMHRDGIHYILLIGKETGEDRTFDRIRAYLT